METRRKVQLGAAIVIANGLLALSVTAPRTALAQSCSDTTTCLPACNATPCINTTPPGCTYVSFTCEGPGCNPGHANWQKILCHYQ